MQLKTLVFSAIVLSSAVATAAAGPGEGGGGNIERSTRADLEWAVTQLPFWLDLASDRYLAGGPVEIAGAPLSAELSRLANAVLGTSAFSMNDAFITYVKNLKVSIVTGACMESGTETDASTTFKSGAAICLSSSRLSRYPKSQLRGVLLPLIIHEISHQKGLDERDANRMQRLAALLFTYRPIYLAAKRAALGCGFATKNPLTSVEQSELAEGRGYFDLKSREDNAMYCGSQALLVGESLDANYNGPQGEFTSSLTPTQRQIALSYRGVNKFDFNLIFRLLRDPSEGGAISCRICKAGGVDPAYLSMLGAKAAVSLIWQEVVRSQSQIDNSK